MAATTFPFHDLAATSKNFWGDFLLGEGGFTTTNLSLEDATCITPFPMCYAREVLT